MLAPIFASGRDILGLRCGCSRIRWRRCASFLAPSLALGASRRRASRPGRTLPRTHPTSARQGRPRRGTTAAAVFGLPQSCEAADYTVRPTRGADNLFLISRASFSAHSPYAHLDGHHQESMHAKVKVLKPSPQTFLSGMHAQLRPIGGRSEPDFSLIQRQGMRISAVTRACTRPR